jgi:hypothetical protein
MPKTKPRRKRLLLLGGSNSTEDIVRFAKKNNVKLIATGKYPKTPLKAISEESYDIDAIDDQALIKLVAEKCIDGIFVGCNETVVPHALTAASANGLPCYCTNRQWELCANKAKFKAMCRKYNIPITAEYSLAENDKIQYPVAVKPVDSCGSQGFSICQNEDELKIAYEKALTFSLSSRVLIEKFMPYDAVIIHYTLINGEILFSGMSDKISMKLKDHGASVMAFQSFPSKFTDIYIDTLDQKVKTMFLQEDFHDGPIWIEAFNNNGKFTFNEMGYRFGGSMTYYPIRYFYGFDQLELILNFSLGKPEKKAASGFLIDNAYQKDLNYCILPLHVNPGYIASVVGESVIKTLPYVYAYIPTHFEGDTIKLSGTVSQVFCYLHVLFTDNIDLRNKLTNIISSLKVFDDANNNLLFCLFDINSLT